MTITLTEQVAKNIIKKLMNGEDYRIEIVTLINAEFLQYTIDFFKKVIDAKLKNKNITVDWYKKEFLNANLPAEDIAIHSGLNRKTISNMYNSATKEIVIEASNNPESADAVIARDSKVFIADKLSDTNKKQLNSLKVEWVELRDKDGYKRFKKALENLNIPHKDFKGDANKELERIFSEI